MHAMFSWFGPEAMPAMLSISRTYENTADYKIQTHSERVKKCDMVQNCRVQMTRPKNIHESLVQAPCKLKTDIVVKLRRVDIKTCCQVLNGVC